MIFFFFCFVYRHRRRRRDFRFSDRRGTAVRSVVPGRVRRPGVVLLRGHVLRIVLWQSDLHTPLRRDIVPAPSRVPEPRTAPQLQARDAATAVPPVRAAQLRRHRKGWVRPGAATVPPTRSGRFHRQETLRRVRGARARGHDRGRHHLRYVHDEPDRGGGRRQTVGRCVAADEIQMIVAATTHVHHPPTLSPPRPSLGWNHPSPIHAGTLGRTDDDDDRKDSSIPICFAREYIVI